MKNQNRYSSRNFSGFSRTNKSSTKNQNEDIKMHMDHPYQPKAKKTYQHKPAKFNKSRGLSAKVLRKENNNNSVLL